MGPLFFLLGFSILNEYFKLIAHVVWSYVGIENELR